MSKPYLLRYMTSDGKHRCYFSDTKEIVQLKQLPKISEYRQYTLFKGYEANDEGLISFANDFNLWSRQLLDSNLPLNIAYDKYFHHSDAVNLTFKRLCNGLYENHTPITRIENKYWSMCYNGGLMYCDPQECMTYSYDKSSYYPKMMADKNFDIPVCEGQEHFLSELPQNIQCGIYRVDISCANDDFKKIFMFSKNMAYTHYSLRTALKYAEMFDVKINLIHDDLPNAYIYHETTTGDKIFKKWFELLSRIKKKYPKNKLVKHLMSSLWGSLSYKNTFKQTAEQINENSYDVGLDYESDYTIIKHVVFDDHEYYELQNNKHPYRSNIRLKPFITSYGRYLMSDVIMQNINAVVRVQTDSVSFNEPMDEIIKKFPDMLPEAKSSGNILWLNVNKYFQIDVIVQNIVDEIMKIDNYTEIRLSLVSFAVDLVEKLLKAKDCGPIKKEIVLKALNKVFVNLTLDEIISISDSIDELTPLLIHSR